MEKKVLVIDHDPTVRNRIASLLLSREIESDQASGQDEAIHLLGCFRYDLVMLDLMLPEENGFKVLEHIRTFFPQQSQHLVVLTSTDPKFLEVLPTEGWCAVLVKPFGASELYRIVELCSDQGHTAGTKYN